MKHPLFKALCGLSLMALCHCGAGGGTDDCCSDNTPSSSVCAETTTWTSSIVLATAASVVTSATQDYNLTASANKKIAAYLINESSTAPSSDAAAWTAITNTKDFSATDVLHTLVDATDGEKTVYAWFKDECGDVATAASTSFTLDATAPAGTLLFDNGAKFTLESDLNVNLSLTATDAEGIASWAITTDNTQPAIDSGAWHDVDTTNLSVNTTVALDTPLHSHWRYAWVKDKAGQVTELSDEIEVMRIIRGTISVAQVGTYTSIATDASNNPQISCYDTDDGRLYLSAIDPMTGNILGFDGIDPEVGFADDYGKGTSIAIDANDRIHIAYRDEGNGKLKYATNASGSWVLTTIENGGRSPNISIDSQGYVHIAHLDDAVVKYVTNTTGNWVSTSVYTDGNFVAGGEFLNMTLDSDDFSHLLYEGVVPRKLMYFTNEGGSWGEELLYTYGGFPPDGSGMSTNGNKILISFSKDDGRFYYAEKSGTGNWNTPIELDSHYGYPSSIVADSEDYVHVVYYYPATQDLKYVSNITGNWDANTIDSNGDVGDFVDMTIDSNNRLHISYYDTTNTVLIYATTADTP